MSELLRVFEFTTAQVRALAKEQSVADAPIVLGDVTVVPISKLSCGFTCGGSDLAAKKKADGLMAGAGAKVSKTPLTFLAIQGGNVRLLCECLPVFSVITVFADELLRHRNGQHCLMVANRHGYETDQRQKQRQRKSHPFMMLFFYFHAPTSG